ncbi:MAG: pantetheine-phosphate adenylyltransferase [Bacteroidetes bacterium]|nr:pantetheine-phosphate adenylyltransferase [Bacteroidota bacterium]
MIYPGTFDPITNGHLDVIARASELFDEVIVAIATNSAKTPLFTEGQRRTLCEEAVAEMLPNARTIRVDAFSGLLVDYAHRTNAVAVVRGLRALSDFEYEFQMSLMNRKLEHLTTVFLMPNERYTYLNSTIIRELARYGRDVSDFVPNCVQAALRKRFEA